MVEHKTADSFTVTYQGTAKNQYVLLVVKAGTDLNSLTADSILYIDQAAADENGVAAFANLTDSTKGFLLKSSQSADVYVGGAELAARRRRNLRRRRSDRTVPIPAAASISQGCR